MPEARKRVRREPFDIDSIEICVDVFVTRSREPLHEAPPLCVKHSL
jgi:hypothetical protein